ncbi:Disintegrin and metalloproteinase domain-containing protein 18 [Galemys pyrenaicus]|uniref:Disintegrin and metalloproteinase domain-containing protein 18 n=1 Tax=Galemys pyrenaicus TaxID=202257 RepID=A0A8J6A4E9_GALPY|nr:Disintegrin and metalloproteinase domain-containing protein 18 [Galemys pyrenaicus]
MHCHYQGYVAGFPNSVATLSICSGIRGFLQFANISYGIEPLQSSARFEHIVYQVRNDNTDIPTKAENYSNIWKKDQPSKDLLSSQFKLTVKLSSLELWSDKNQISTNGSADDLLQRFLAWKVDSFILRPHDVAFLLTYRKHPKYIGATFPATICNKSYNAGIAMYPDTITLEGYSVIIAQLLGLKIGLTYDDIHKCSCPRDICIMNHEAVYSSGIKIFSNCSVNDYRYFVSKHEDKCLKKISNVQPLYQNRSVCGNGILEPNEECDCGRKEECQFKMCCDYNTCKLIGSAKCGSGSCCTSKCEISVAGTPCRKSVDEECDFTEYCNGNSSNCVPDTYAFNGKLCNFGTAYCYNGQCQTTDNQCAKIVHKVLHLPVLKKLILYVKGLETVVSKIHNRYLVNRSMDVLCGKLACVWPHNNTSKINVQSEVYSNIQGHFCLFITAGSSVRSDGRDYVYVADGTVCGPQMYCINKICKKAHFTGYSCNATAKCKGNGICNNLGNCHCFPGYRPPDCIFQYGSPGGSIDDGNVQKSDMISFKKGYNAHLSNWLILSFYIVLPFFIIFIVMIMKLNEVKISCKRVNAEYEG